MQEEDAGGGCRRRMQEEDAGGGCRRRRREKEARYKSRTFTRGEEKLLLFDTNRFVCFH